MIGRYYLERRDYTGAINRFKVVVTQYQTTRHVEEALVRLTEAYMALGIVPEAQTAAAVLGHNFPDSTWYRHAYNLVKSGGVEPSENRGSWISRAFKRSVWAKLTGNSCRRDLPTLSWPALCRPSTSLTIRNPEDVEPGMTPGMTTARTRPDAMLSRLSIRDIVLIDRLDIDFAAGLAVLTGETGAGKSILLDSFALALGGRGDPGIGAAGH